MTNAAEIARVTARALGPRLVLELIGGWWVVDSPVVWKTIAVETARKIAIVDQMIGKARGGGVHHGLRRSLNTGSLVLAFGRELSNGENTRLFNAIKHEKNPTKYVAIVRGICEAQRPCKANSNASALSTASGGNAGKM